MKLLLAAVLFISMGLSAQEKKPVYLFVTYSFNGLTGAGWVKGEVQETGYENIDTTFSWIKEKSKRFPTSSILTNEFSKRGWVLDKVSEAVGVTRLYIFKKEYDELK